jgi:sodium-dependent dicarboxylate transporter 2/3/5
MGLFAGPLLAALTYHGLPDAYADGSGGLVPFGHAGKATSAAGVWMAVWWMTEAIPIYATALLPLAILPATGAVRIRAAAAPYGHELIFLFMGGFILALAMQRWGLHRRIAFRALRVIGKRPGPMVAGFMGVAAGLSMWVSNTATTIMMLPIATSVIDLVTNGGLSAGTSASGATVDPVSARNRRNFALCLLLGVAYGASIGGIGTLIGTPPNLFLASFVESEFGVEISFVRWMGIGLPLVVVFLPIAWLLLSRVLYPFRGVELAAGTPIRDAVERLGPMKRGEWITLIVFLVTAALWIFRPLLAKIAWGTFHPFGGLTDPGIAILAALSLFVIPVEPRRRIFVMDWETAVRLPWGLLVLFGGGLSLAAAVRTTGVGELLGHRVEGFAGLPPIVLVLVVTALMIHLTELTSNTASTATLVPILAALAPGLGVSPFLLIVPATIAASGAFMLPVATPPNAIVFGSGHVTIPQMCRAGVWLNLIGIVLITGLAYLVALPLLGVDPAAAATTAGKKSADAPLPMTMTAEAAPASTEEKPPEDRNAEAMEPDIPLSEFDRHWDYDDPAGTEERFRALLPRVEGSDDPSLRLQLLTQIARTQSLQRKFDEAHRILDGVEAELPTAPPVVRVRHHLERGRTFNSAGKKEEARAAFVDAWDAARAAGEDGFAVDAAHMMGIVESGAESVEWTEKALELAASSSDERARRWRGSLYNNLGWTYHEDGRYEKALEYFEEARRCREEDGNEELIRIARWCVARGLRSLHRIDEALAIQKELRAEHEASGSEDGYVCEELGELHWIRGEEDVARPWFARAWEILSRDAWLVEAEPERLARLRRLGGLADGAAADESSPEASPDGAASSEEVPPEEEP